MTLWRFACWRNTVRTTSCSMCNEKKMSRRAERTHQVLLPHSVCFLLQHNVRWCKKTTYLNSTGCFSISLVSLQTSRRCASVRLARLRGMCFHMFSCLDVPWLCRQSVPTDGMKDCSSRLFSGAQLSPVQQILQRQLMNCS